MKAFHINTKRTDCAVYVLLYCVHHFFFKNWEKKNDVTLHQSNHFFAIVLVFSAFNKDQWLQVDFLVPQNLSGILTQGSPDMDRWVGTYSVSTSMDGYTFYPVRNYDGAVAVFGGNSDRNSIARNFFPHVSKSVGHIFQITHTC